MHRWLGWIDTDKLNNGMFRMVYNKHSNIFMNDDSDAIQWRYKEPAVAGISDPPL